MNIKEMIYVLDKEKECVQRRSDGKCEKDCEHCDCSIEPSSLLDALERIINLVFNTDKNSTRKDF